MGARPTALTTWAADKVDDKRKNAGNVKQKQNNGYGIPEREGADDCDEPQYAVDFDVGDCCLWQ